MRLLLNDLFQKKFAKFFFHIRCPTKCFMVFLVDVVADLAVAVVVVAILASLRLQPLLYVVVFKAALKQI